MRWLLARPISLLDPFAGLVSLHDLELMMFDPDRGGRLFHTVGGPGHAPTTEDSANHHCSASQALDDWGDGRTLIFNGIDRQLPAIAELARGLEGELKTRVWCNLYLTPAHGHGFITHYDSHDVFVLQLIGSKSWRMGACAADAPMPFQMEEAMPRMGPHSTVITLEMGDSLYIPRGVLHDACAQDDLSCHLTIGLHPKTYLDAILTAVTIAADRDPRFRRYLPIGAFNLGPDETAEARRLMRLISEEDFREVGEAFCELLAAQRQRSPMGLLGLMGRGGKLKGGERFRAAPHLMSSLSLSDEKVELHALGKVAEFPSRLSSDLELCCNGRPFGLQDLRCQDSVGAAADFLRRLLLLGVVQCLNAGDPGTAVPVDLIRHGSR
ncbi:MAG: JmjC domain-containing protein [Caulobacteraceae bacterium]